MTIARTRSRSALRVGLIVLACLCLLTAAYCAYMAAYWGWITATPYAGPADPKRLFNIVASAALVFVLAAAGAWFAYWRLSTRARVSPARRASGDPHADPAIKTEYPTKT
jgi:hypothetical protein